MRKIALCLAGLAWLTPIPPAFGQDIEGRMIRSVGISGLRAVSESLVRSKLEVQPGQTFNAPAIARDIRRLYELGYFVRVQADAQLEDDQIVLTYVLEEKRVVEKVKIVGNDKLRTRQIRSVISWQEGDPFVPEAYDEERDAILKLYQSKGFPNAAVDIIVDEVSPSRVRVTYTIAEGKKARIRSIRFEGNTVLSDRKLRKLMTTKRAWWLFGGKYDESKLNEDLKSIPEEYGNYGHLEADVVLTDFAYAAGGKRVDVTIHILEGPLYTVEALEIADNVVFDDDEISRIVRVHAGDVHNKGQVEKDAGLVEKGYRDSGYVTAQATPQVTLDRDMKTTHVVHRIEEGDLKYVKEIKVTGNTVTKDEVVRRELLVTPGERFDGGMIEASQKRLDNTHFYENIRLSLEPIELDDKFANLMVDVEEAETGAFNFGAGYSTEEKFGGFLELRLINFDIANWPTFSGGGQQFMARIETGDVRSEYRLSFTDPEIAGYPLAFGFDVFNESYEYRTGAEFAEETRGLQLRLGKVLSPYVSARTALSYRDIDISDIPFFAPPVLMRERGGSTTISSVWGISRNTLDYHRDPTSGARHDLELQVAGLGGDNHFFKMEHDFTWYRALDEEKRWILSLRTREGWASEYGSSDFVPISDRFFAGGTTTVRGYDQRDIGPKVRQRLLWGDEVAIGGELRLVENIEIKYKLTKQFRLYGFIDAGGVWENSSDFDLGEIKYSAGLGFGVDIPKLGPIRVDYGFPLNPEDDQGSGRLHMQTGLRF